MTADDGIGKQNIRDRLLVQSQGLSKRPPRPPPRASEYRGLILTEWITSFTNEWSRDTIYDLVETFTDNSFLIDLSFLQWPLFNYTFEKEESRAAATAFTDYLMDQISGE